MLRSQDVTQVCFNIYFIPLDSAHMLLVILNPDQGDVKSLAESEVNVEMQRCGAYEVV